ncbi:MAG: rhodanese-like domain-containing protein [Cytophagales bacterium]|nr:MAG: rhodanese-like domain-containing protein [Cytophagales bacterium]
MKQLKNYLMFLGMLFMFACQSAGQAEYQLNADDFEKKYASMPDAQLVDVRTAQEFGGGHLAKAMNMDVKSSDFTSQITKLDKNKPVFVYCLAGSRSATAADILRKEGFKQVYELSGGFRAWTSAGKKIEQ